MSMKGCEKMAYKITKDSIIGEVLDNNSDLADLFMEMGMHCLGCPASRGETIEEACIVHNVNCEEIVSKLNVRITVLK